MSLTVEGQKCPVCNGYMFDEDDIVFCPKCGAPHHRECYHAVGHCGLEQFHDTENEYRRPEAHTEEAQPENKEKTGEAVIKVRCISCGEEFYANEESCPQCGAPAPGRIMYTPFGTPVNFDPLGGVPPQFKLEDGTSAKDVANYTAINTPRYVRKFFSLGNSLGKKKRTSWNWAAFLFPGAWFFYRKIYFPGALFFIFTVIATLLTSALQYAFGDMTFATTNEMANYMAQHPEIIISWPGAIFLAGSILNLIVRIFAGLFGDWMYRSSALERIKQAKEDIDSEDSEPLRIRKKGGVNLFLGVLMYWAVNWAYYLIALFI